MSSQPVVIRWGLEPLIDFLSNSLVNELRIAGFPNLVDDEIAFGGAALSSRRAPPSIVAMLATSESRGADPHGDAPIAAPVNPILNALDTEILRIDFHCWAAASPSDSRSVGDADAVRFLYSQLWKCIFKAAQGNYRVVSVDHSKDPPTAIGSHAIMRVEFQTPVIGCKMRYVQPGTTSAESVNLDGGSSFVIELPATN